MTLKKMLRAGGRFLSDPDYRFLLLDEVGVYDRWDDAKYLKRKYKAYMKKELNLEEPKTFNEKLQWLKIYDHNPAYTIMVDKNKAKEFVSDKLDSGEQYIIPTLGVWDNFDEIDFSMLPNQFVLKCTHDSGNVVICKDKGKFDIKKAKKVLDKSLKNNFYLRGREWPYKNVPRKIIAEKYMVDSSTTELRDYKFFCFGGQCRCMKVDFDRFIEHRANYYDKDRNLLDLGETVCPPDKDKNILLPDNMDQMIALAEQLSKEVPFLRVDFYDVDGHIYFGELTFFPASGFGTFTDEKWDFELGKWLELPKSIGGGYLTYDGQMVYIFHTSEKQNEDPGLRDYKFYCFDGKVKLLMIASNRFSKEHTSFDYFDRDFNHVDLVWGNPNSKVLPKKPQTFEKMVEIAEKLSDGIPHVRVDLYECNGRDYFGELTFFDGSGFGTFEDPSWDEKMGEWLTLPKKWGGGSELRE